MSKNFITKSPIEFNKTGALISLLMANFLGALSVSIINIILPTLQSSFHVSYELIQWVIISYLISNTSLVVIAGKIGDTFNKRNIILLGQMIFIIASIICFYSTTAVSYTHLDVYKRQAFSIGPDEAVSVITHKYIHQVNDGDDLTLLLSIAQAKLA